MAGYDATKAAAFNKLVQSGISQDAAFIQSGIADADAGNYALGTNGQLGAVVALGSKANTAPPVDSGLPPPNTAPTASAAQELLITGQGGQATQNLENIVESQKNIEISQTNIQENQAASLANQQSIVDARAIIALQNTEIADEALPDSRRLVLEANNAEQLAVIGQAEQNIAFNANNIESSQTNITANQAAIGVNAAGFQAVTGVGIAPPPVAPADDPFEAARLDAQARFNEPVAAIEPAVVAPEDDPFEAARLEAEARLNDPPAELEPADVGAEELGNDYGFTSDETAGADPTPLGEPAPVENPPYDENAGLEEAIRARAAEPVNEPLTAAQTEAALEEASAGATLSAEDVDAANDRDLEVQEEIRAEAADGGISFPDTNNDTTSAFKALVKSQGTLQSRYKQPGNGDWRVRLSLAPSSDYLYNATEAGILGPLTATNGVIFPYTPKISTSYTADYAKAELIHSNYRGLFYKSSSVGDVQINGTFTAQDTREAAYLLAVIHFFRSVTKMFYGNKDAQRGTPPPLVYLSGYGDYQFSNHACVVSSFNYSLPNEVDYIRTNAPNNFGPNMSNRQTPRTTSPGGINFSGAIRLANALLNKGALPQTPAQNPLRSYVNNTNECTYVPTKMEIDIVLTPVQTRSQVSKQFSLKEFANGNLLRGGFW